MVKKFQKKRKPNYSIKIIIIIIMVKLLIVLIIE